MANERYPKKSAEQRAHETIGLMGAALAEAMVAIDPDERTKTALEVFPEPTERRTDTEFNLSPEQERAFREAMAKLGIGRETNLGASEVGLQPGYVAIIEGGLAHKVAAEINLVLTDPNTRPSRIVVTAAPDRKILPNDEDKARERHIIAEYLGIAPHEVGDNEHEMVKQLFLGTPGYSPEAESVYAAGYASNGMFISDEHTGQFVRLGRFQAGYEVGPKGDIPVILMRIDREYDESGKYKQPGPREVIDIIDRIMRRDGDDSEIGFVTSSTYQPSREVDASVVMLGISGLNPHDVRNIGVMTYGTAELTKVKRESTPQPPHLGQLAGEAHKAAKQLLVLREMLEAEQA